MISSMVMPSSRFSNIVATGSRVPRNTHAPLTLPGTLSTAGHVDQSNAIAIPHFLDSIANPETRCRKGSSARLSSNRVLELHLRPVLGQLYLFTLDLS